MRWLSCLLLAGQASAATVDVTIEAPTHNVDGTLYEDPGGYRIYSGCAEAGVFDRAPVVVDDPAETAITIDGLPDTGLCRFRATAVNDSGIESDFSDVVLRHMGVASAPGEPGLSIAWRGHVMPISVGTVGTLAYTTTHPNTFSVTLPADVDGLLVVVPAFFSDPNTINATFDPGGGSEVVKAATFTSDVSLSGQSTAMYLFDKGELPQGGGTFDVEVDTDAPGDAVAAAALPILADGAGVEVEQTGSSADSGGGTQTVTTSFAAAIQSGSLVVQGCSNGTNTSHLFNDLANEVLDSGGSAGGGNQAAVAYEIDPTETQDYSISNTGTSRKGCALVEIVALAPGQTASLTEGVDAGHSFGGEAGAAASFDAEVSMDSSDAAQAAAEALIANGADLGSSFIAVKAIAVNLSNSVTASDSFGALAGAAADLVGALEAGDSDAAAAAAESALAAQVTVADQYQALRVALVAIEAGLAAGESWAALAAAESGLLLGTELTDEFLGETTGAQAAAFAAGSDAADLFLVATAQFAGVASSLDAGAEFGANTATPAALSETTNLGEQYQALSQALSTFSAAVALGATFTAQASNDVSIVGAVASVKAMHGYASTVTTIGIAAAEVRELRIPKGELN